MDSHSMTRFLTELAGTTALVFLSFYGAYLAAALFVHSSEHGTVLAWRGLRERMSLLLPRDHVRICSSPALAVIRGTLEEVNQRDLRNFLSWLNEIARIEKRLEVLRNRLRFAAVSAIVAVASGVVLTGPVLFGLPPLTDKVRNSQRFYQRYVF